MGIVYAPTARTDRMQVIADAIDAGSGAGKLKLYTAGYGTLLATVVLTDPCGSVVGDDLIFDFDPDISTTAAADGLAGAASITDSDDNVVVSNLTAGAVGTHVTLDNPQIVATQTITIRSAVLRHNTGS